jgi:hypothetical protein
VLDQEFELRTRKEKQKIDAQKKAEKTIVICN